LNSTAAVANSYHTLAVQKDFMIAPTNIWNTANMAEKQARQIYRQTILLLYNEGKQCCLRELKRKGGNEIE